MNFTSLVQQVADHFQGKQVERISMCCEKDPLLEDRINPCTLRSSSIMITFTDGTYISIDPISITEGCSQESRLRMAFSVDREIASHLAKHWNDE